MKDRPPWATALQFAGIGWFIAGSIVLGVLGGEWLDGKAGTSPLFLLIGMFLGITVAFYGSYRMAAVYLTGRKNAQRPKRPRS